MRAQISLFWLTALTQRQGAAAFVTPSRILPRIGVWPSPTSICTSSFSNDNNGDQDDLQRDAERMKKQAEELREQIRRMEEKLQEERRIRGINDANDDLVPSAAAQEEEGTGQRSLRNKRILVAGANGRLGSMVCRHLLRNHPQTEVVAAVHYVGENSPTSRGYARLSYEVGAEDGIGTIGAAWSSEDRVATFEYDPVVMAGYNLRNLRLVECELLDPVQCQSVVEGVDAVIWCATDFNGNAPRAVASLDIAFLFRAISRPAKGRVEVEGLQNMLGALKLEKQEQKRRASLVTSKTRAGGGSPVEFVHISMVPGTYIDFETPFGSFWGIKSQSEQIVRNDFPSLTNTILQFGQYDDNFVPEGLELQYEASATDRSTAGSQGEIPPLFKINRRDAARAAVDALLKDEWEGKTVKVWTDKR